MRWIRARRVVGLALLPIVAASAIGAPSPPSTLAFLGDSILQQMTPVQGSLPEPFSGATNLATSGYVVAQIRMKVPSIPGTATQVLIEGGVNDLFLGTASAIVPGYAAMLRSIPTDKQVVLAGILPVDEAALRSDLSALIDNARIAAINAQLVALCRAFANCVPASSAMSMNMTGKTVDGIHLKQTTYKEWAALVEIALAARVARKIAAN
jgi:lysophospholipase L1-like esterase